MWRDKSDCAVFAIHQATGIDYLTVYKALEDAGRKKGKGTPFVMTRTVLAKLGFVCTELRRQIRHTSVLSVEQSESYRVRTRI